MNLLSWPFHYERSWEGTLCVYRCKKKTGLFKDARIIVRKQRQGLRIKQLTVLNNPLTDAPWARHMNLLRVQVSSGLTGAAETVVEVDPNVMTCKALC